MRERVDGGRAVVIDRALHRRMRTDMTLDVARSARGVHAVGAAVVVLGVVLGRPAVGVVVALAGVVGWVALRWLQLGRTMRHGLGVGQRISVGPDVQTRAGASVVRAITLSADAMMPVVAALAFLVVGVWTGSGPWLTVGAVFAGVFLLTTPRGALRARSRIRAAYPVGRTLRAEVTAESITTELDAVALAVRWERYDARRITAGAVLLRTTGPFLSPDVFTVYPRELFDDAAIETLAAAVPRTF